MTEEKSLNMDFSKLNPSEWIKNIFKELENIRYCYFLAYLIIYFLLCWVPSHLDKKLELFKYINILSLFAILSIVFLLGKFINFISLKIEKFFYEKEVLKHLETLNPDELRALSLGVVGNQTTVYMAFDDQAAVSILQKGLIIKCDGNIKEESKPWPYIIPDFVWNKIIKDIRFKKQSKEEILNVGYSK